MLLPAVRDFGAEAVFLSAGFDAHAADPLASMTLGAEDFSWLTAEVARLGLPIVSVLEGGYGRLCGHKGHSHGGSPASDSGGKKGGGRRRGKKGASTSVSPEPPAAGGGAGTGAGAGSPHARLELNRDNLAACAEAHLLGLVDDQRP